jgi:hypothetical protein
MTPRKDDHWGIGQRADGTIDSVPLSEWPKRAAEIKFCEEVWDQVLQILQEGDEDQSVELDLNALSVEELVEIIKGLSEDEHFDDDSEVDDRVGQQLPSPPNPCD